MLLELEMNNVNRGDECFTLMLILNNCRDELGKIIKTIKNLFLFSS